MLQIFKKVVFLQYISYTLYFSYLKEEIKTPQPFQFGVGAESLDFTSSTSYIFGIFVVGFTKYVPVQLTGATVSIYGLTSQILTYSVSQGTIKYHSLHTYHAMRKDFENIQIF